MVKSESDVLGEYELKVGKGKIGLKILPDRSFSETIFWPTGKVENRSGKWLWAENGISFDQLWIPSEFAPDYILQADASAKENKQPKYTEPGHWFMRAEKHWGTVTLPIFPDADVSFEMVRPAAPHIAHFAMCGFRCDPECVDNRKATPLVANSGHLSKR